uniref:Immunoglobulin domain-containing protein n=1 Tax=Cyprinus carpio carpio TaxID=630221 RepID=A0A8C1DLE0_CYPCA
MVLTQNLDSYLSKMFRMCVVLLFFSSICTVVVGAPVTVIGHTGESLNIRCTYESGYESNPKYLCKGECNIGNKVIMVKSGSPAEDQRFSLSDDRTARVFTVTITDLRLEDEGQYWCGVKRTGTDVYSEIVLLVKHVGGGAPVIVTGYRGERFDIRCTYESGYESNPKYLCKGACNIGNKVIVVKSGSPAEDQRFSLSDNTTARVFTVTITDLRLEDEGQYWCGVERSLSADVYSEILLLVKMVVVGAPVKVTGHTGERADIRCTYESGYESNPKYLCKGACNFGNKVIVVKSGSPAEDQRFSLSDNTTARVFTITITELRPADEGQYWCGVKRTGTDVYSEILLLVKQEPSYFSTTETNPQSSSITVSDQNKSTDAVSEIYICVED